MGTVTLTETSRHDLGKLQLILASLTPSNSYATGGDSLAATAFPGRRVAKIVDVIASPKSGYSFEWDATNGKLKAFRAYPDYAALSAPGLVIGSVAPEKVKIANTTVYLCAGIFKSKSSAEVAFTPTDHDIAPNAASVQEACYAVSLQADGDPVLTKGTVATGAGNAAMPDCPAGETLIGYVRIAVALGATLFNASTDTLAAGHLTVTYVDVTEPQSREVKSASDLSGVTTRAWCLLGQA